MPECSLWSPKYTPPRLSEISETGSDSRTTKLMFLICWWMSKLAFKYSLESESNNPSTYYTLVYLWCTLPSCTHIDRQDKETLKLFQTNPRFQAAARTFRICIMASTDPQAVLTPGAALTCAGLTSHCKVWTKVLNDNRVLEFSFPFFSHFLHLFTRGSYEFGSV